MPLRSYRLEQRLASMPAGPAALLTTLAAFGTYFCMYGLRKPWSVARFEGADFAGTEVTLKTAFVVAQLIGYTCSKYMGVRLVPEVRRAQRLGVLLGLVVSAWLALGLFALLPPQLRIVAIFLNGIPLGMVWGVVLGYLEGRRASEAMMAGLSVSFILASGVVKDVGAWVLRCGADEASMPFLTGAIFLPLLSGFAVLLDHAPEPSTDDVAERAPRQPMRGGDRAAFTRRFLPGLVLLFSAYFCLTALRDFRDNYAVDMLLDTGASDTVGRFSQMEIPAALAVVAAFGALSFIRDNRRGLVALFVLMVGGLLVVAAASLAFCAGMLDGVSWLVLTGVGGYLAYVPFGSMLFERLMAHTRATGTAVFAAQLADAIGYTGSLTVSLYKDLGAGAQTRAAFFADVSVVTGVGGAIAVLFAGVYFVRASPQPKGKGRSSTLSPPK